MLVPENELKWQEVRPSATAYRFDKFDAMLAYAESRAMLMRGHTLLWYVQERFPAWLQSYNFGATPVAEAERLVREHVQTVTRRYGNRIYSYDVVNEAVDPATGGLRTNALATAAGGGTRLLDLAFATARAEAPNAQLVYNDYMDWGGGSTHRDGVLALLRGFRDRGVPVDALGIQGHIGYYSTIEPAAIVDARRAGWRAFLDAVVALGYDLVVTEFDVNDDDQIARFDAAARDERTRVLARGYLDIAMSYPQLRDVLVWGMSDRFSWIQNAARTRRPNPYDLDYAAKPLRTALIEAFTAAAARPAPPARPR